MPLGFSSIPTDVDGKSLYNIGSSIHVSGRSDVSPSTEVRRISIGNGAYIGDMDSSIRQAAVWNGDDAEGLFPSEVTASDARGYGGMRIANASETYICVPTTCIPFGWKATHVYVSFYSKHNQAGSTKVIEVFSRSRAFGESATPSNSDHIVVHKSHNDSPSPKTNQRVLLSTPYIPADGTSLHIFISVGSSNSIYLGSYIDIVRI